MDIRIIVEDTSLQTMGFEFAYARIEEDRKTARVNSRCWSSARSRAANRSL
jgi:hypothetical protein